MSFSIVSTKRFLKAVQKLKKSGRRQIVEAVQEAVQLLAVHDARSLYVLATRWRDHALKGDKSGLRELHLGFDDLLLYRIDNEVMSIELVNIVNHEELSKQ